METERVVHAHAARAAAVRGERAEALLQMAREQSAYDPAVFDEADPFFWRAEISSSRLDAYYTHMAASTLSNFARAAAEGVSFQNSHRWHEMPLGRSLTGEVRESGEETVVEADFFTLAGLRLAGVNTNDFIAGVRSGIVHDVSVGFYGGRWVCDICGRNYLSFECPHFAGLEYEREEDGVVRTQLATVEIRDARLAEVSAVYDGATPGAAILKAERMAAEGQLTPKLLAALEERYRVSLPAAMRTWPGWSETDGDEAEADRLKMERARRRARGLQLAELE